MHTHIDIHGDMFVHAVGRYVFRGTAGEMEEEKKKNEGRLRLGCGVCRSGDHMSHFAPCVVSDGLGFMLNNHVGVENKPYENPEERVAVRTGARLKRPHVSLNNSSVITPTVYINTHEHRHKHTAIRT